MTSRSPPSILTWGGMTEFRLEDNKMDGRLVEAENGRPGALKAVSWRAAGPTVAHYVVKGPVWITPLFSPWSAAKQRHSLLIAICSPEVTGSLAFPAREQSKRRKGDEDTGRRHLPSKCIVLQLT